MPVSKLPTRAQTDLEDSGIEWQPLLKNRVIAPASPAELRTLLGAKVDDVECGLLYTYYQLNEDFSLSPIPHKQYCRAKMYYKPLTGFAAVTGVDERAKYLQRAGTSIQLYVPPILDWKEFAARKEVHLYITEGEKKALAMAQLGYYCVAVGGVNSVANSRNEEVLLPALVQLARMRHVQIIFDVDKGYRALKPMVAKAADSLAARLIKAATADPRIVVLKADGTRKVALDDFCKEFGTDPAFDLILGSRALRNHDSIMVHEENERFVYINESNAVGNTKTRFLMQPTAYANSRNNQQILLPDLYVNKDGVRTVRQKPVRLAEGWLKWEGRRTAERADYMPGCGEVVVGDTFNTWKGWAQQPTEAAFKDIKPFVDALQYLHGDDWEFMFNWYMYPLANPGGKLYTIPVLQSEFEGIGKSVVPEMMSSCVYGAGVGDKPGNSWTLNAGSLEDKRLEFAAESQFILLDDVRDLDKLLEMLNALATQETLAVNEKYVRSRRVRNCINMVITTNRTNPVRITELNRRLYYPHVNHVKNDELWKKRFVPFMQHGGGGKLLGYAAGEWKKRNAGYDPRAAAPMTEKKEEMVELSRTQIDEWAHLLLTRRSSANKELVTASELREAYMAEKMVVDEEKVSKVMFSRALKVVGLPKLSVPRVKVGDTTHVVYVMKNDAKWGRADHSTAAAYLAKAPPLKFVKGR